MKYWFNLLYKSLGKRLYIGVFWAFLTLVSGVALLMLSGWFITATALTGLAISAGIVVLFDMYMPGSGIRFFTLSRTIGRYIERLYNHDSILRLISVFRVKLFSRLSELSLSELRATSDSEWLSKLTADLDALDGILLRYTIPPIATLLMCLTLTIFASFFWFELAMYLGVFMLLCLLLIIRLTIRYTKEYAATSASLLNETRALVIEHLQGAFELQSYHLMEQHEAKLNERLKRFYQVQNSLNARVANIQFLLDVSLGVVATVLIGLTLFGVNAEIIDGAIALMFVMMFVASSEVLQTFPSQFSTWGKTHYSANRLSKLVGGSGQDAQLKDEKSFCDLETIEVCIENNPKISASQMQAMSFKLEQQQLINIKGRSGAGKSSLANLLMGLVTTDQNNRILVNSSVSLNRIPCSHWFAQVSYLEQSNTILAGTLGYNLALGIHKVSENDIWSALRLVELEQWAQKLPNGINTWLGETGGKVSGGQARRICLARLLLREPKLILLDEPFNGIDDSMATRIWQNISPWLAQRMVILMSHETPFYIKAQDKKSAVLDLDLR